MATACGRLCRSACGDGGRFPPTNSICQALLCSHAGRSSVAGPLELLFPLHITPGAGKFLLLTKCSPSGTVSGDMPCHACLLLNSRNSCHFEVSSVVSQRLPTMWPHCRLAQSE